MTSNFLRLNLNDFTKGLIMTAVGASLIVVYQAFTNDCGITCIDWMASLNAGISGGLAYLIKNLFSDEQGKLGGKL